MKYFDAELCKGSTTDSDSVCEGSNPSSAAMAPILGPHFRGVAQLGRALRSGRRGRWFESSHLDHRKKGPQTRALFSMVKRLVSRDSRYESGEAESPFKELKKTERLAERGSSLPTPESSHLNHEEARMNTGKSSIHAGFFIWLYVNS